MNVVLAIVTNILFGLLTSHLAQRRGRDGTTWFVVGVLLGLLGVILLYLFPNKQDTVGKKEVSWLPQALRDLEHLILGTIKMLARLKLCPSKARLPPKLPQLPN